MTRGKRIAIVLGATAAALAVLALAQQAGLGQGYRLAEGEAAPAVPKFAAIEREAMKLPPWGEYGDIVARPVFNESRLPEAVPESGAEGETGEATTAPLNVTLTGVILMPNLKLAFVRDNATNTVQRVRVGNPLEGEQNGWKLVELQPRGAVFEGAGLGRQELELATDTTGAAPSAAAGPAATPATPADGAAAADPNQPVPAQRPGEPLPSTGQPPSASDADAIRRRIEERRRQLREEAQRMMQDPQNNQ